MRPRFDDADTPFTKPAMPDDHDRPASPMSGQQMGPASSANGAEHDTDPTPARKGRVALACSRCISLTSSRYINALEERIAFLEARLPAYAEDHFAATSAATLPLDGRVSGTTRHPSNLESSSSHRGSISEDPEGEDDNSIVDGVAYLSLCASGTTGTAPEPFYLGSSSGAAIARMIQKSIFRNRSSRAVAHDIRSAHTSRHSDLARSHLAASTASVPLGEPLFEFPFLDEARLLFDVFFDRMHTRWPILDRKAYSILFERQYDQGALSITQRSIMHLIYAIAARFLQLTRKLSGVDPEQQLLAAIEPMDHILEQHNLATVQFLLLLAVHGQRSPYGAGAWSQVRYAVSLCIELGLHRERNSARPGHSARDLEIRRRAFWSCYCLDRGTSVVLGRPFAIADRDINVALPKANPELWDLTHKEPPEISSGTYWCNIDPFIHIIKLEMIHSRIHRVAFRVDQDLHLGSAEGRARLDEKMSGIRTNLDEWIQTIPQPSKDSKKITWLYDPESASHDAQDFYNLQYHKVNLLMFTVLLPTLPPTDPRFVATAQSAASVCIAYKRLNQQRTLTYTMISLHSCFVAGLSLVYCVWRDRSLFSYDVFEATQACSQSLTIFGEKWAGAVKYRDIFDALSGSLFKTLVNPIGPSGKTGLGLSDAARRRPLKVALDKDNAPNIPTTSSSENRKIDKDVQEPSMNTLVSDAVKEAFMEVDEEAPGGWQGWRMWNEMLGEDTTAGSSTINEFGELPRNGQVNGWSAFGYDGQGYPDAGGMADAQSYDAMDDSSWGFCTN
ncbi:hypothetical protein S7711_03613 [Stachybotrys chartarum IBT 7711]|uniref:Xylanolytic transcriptional activator regulatory domain-containing protein n=1 Tax=Stachybotrys chartarum (strain CBS 109288 / IBT 7711) TaxID=1280523 RepID=A0A084AGW8_STACB|nr:hypothetical protein S7711_03613 [Stachybotrys chartarum IBT 7711]